MAAEEIHFRKNGTTYHLDWQGSDAPSQERLWFKGSRTDAVSVPAMLTQGTAVYSGGKDPTFKVKIYYDTSSPTIAFRKNGATYYCSKGIKYAGQTSGSIVSTSLLSIILSSNWREKDITVNFKLSKTSSGSGISSPRYRLKYSVITNEGLSCNIYKSGDSWSGTTQNASYSSVLEIVSNGGNSGAKVVIRFELWDDLNDNKISSTDVTINGGWYSNDSSSGGGGSGGE